jgi:hypothetical protein
VSQQLADHNDRLELQRDLEDALKRAERGKATPEDWILLAWACGISREKLKSQRSHTWQR